MNVIQIVASLPPSIDGVGHYALALAKEMKRTHDVQTTFVACKSGLKGADVIDGFPVYRLSEQTPQALHSALMSLCSEVLSPTSSGMPVLLQMSAYGYHKHAFPFWLEKGLRNWLREKPQARLITMFHELYASGPPWKKSFWVSPLQRLVASRITRMSASVLTNMHSRVDDLTKWDSSKQGRVQVLPVPSNVGEPVNVPLLHVRSKRLIVFGQAASRLRVWGDAVEQIEAICGMLGVTEICDVGPATGHKFPAIAGVNIVSMGVLTESEVSRLMLDSVAGFIDYSPGYLAKSGIFAAYCAHGLLPIVTGKSTAREADVKDGEHYLGINGDSGIIAIDKAQLIADKAREWYQEHNIMIQAEIFAGVLHDKTRSTE